VARAVQHSLRAVETRRSSGGDSLGGRNFGDLAQNLHPMRALHAVLPVAILLGSIAACGSDGTGPGPEADGGTPDVPADGPPAWANAQGERRAALPKQAPAKTTFFTTSDACAQCHTAGDGKVMRDAKGRDISPVTTFRPSMMSMAARDPFYLAVVDEERSARPGAESLVDGACTKCHAPAACAKDVRVNREYCVVRAKLKHVARGVRNSRNSSGGRRLRNSLILYAGTDIRFPHDSTAIEWQKPSILREKPLRRRKVKRAVGEINTITGYPRANLQQQVRLCLGHIP